jgi:hypothetical protein
VQDAQAKSPLSDPPISDVAPADRKLTGYDEQHLVTDLRLLDADAEGADWQEAAKIVLRIGPEREPDRAWERHLRMALEMRDAIGTLTQWWRRLGYDGGTIEGLLRGGLVG